MKIENNFTYHKDKSIVNINTNLDHSNHPFYRSELDYNDNNISSFSLNGIWKCLFNENGFDKDSLDYLENFKSTEELSDIKVPLFMELQGFGNPHYVNQMYAFDGKEKLNVGEVPSHNPFMLYVRDFDFEENTRDLKVNLTFEGVLSSFYVYLNGEFVGYSAQFMTPSEFEITKFLKKGTNRLCVFVFKFSSASWLHDQDMWKMAGIFRDVRIDLIPKTHLVNIESTSTLTNNYKDGIFDAKLEMSGKIEGELLIEIYKDNELVASEHKKIDNIVNFNIRINDVEPWSSETPNLYLAKFTIKNNNKIIEISKINIGFRTVEIQDNIFKINGKRVVFHGTNRVEWDMYNGQTMSYELIENDLKLLKENNFNAIRCSHYPNDTKFYDLCDKYGFYVIDEADLETHGTWQEARGIRVWDRLKESCTPAINKEWKSLILARQYAMVRRDFNHPSVVIWSIGNECSAGENTLDAYQLIKKLDSSRPVHYESCYAVKGHEKDSDFYSRMYAKPKEIDEYMKSSDNRPMIECEYEHSMGVSDGNFDMYIDREEKYPRYQGGFIWDFCDQGLVKVDTNGKEFIACGGDFNDRPHDGNFNCNGLLNSNRNIAKKSFKLARAKKAYEPLKIIIHGEEVTITNKNLFLNTDIYKFKYERLIDGEAVLEKEFFISIEPLTTKTIKLNIDNINNSGEIINRVTAYINESIYYLEKGNEIAFGEEIVNDDYKNISKYFSNKDSLIKKAIYVPGAFNEGLYFDDNSLRLIACLNNPTSLISLSVHGEEIIYDKVMPTFWRAMTDNDFGNRFAYDSSVWFACSKFMYSLPNDTEIITNENNSKIIKITYHMPSINDEATVSISYSLVGNDTCEITFDYSGSKSKLPSIPLFGLRFPLNFKLKEYTYYGKGPFDTYIDCEDGAKMGKYTLKTSIADIDGINTNLDSYNVPSNPRVQDIGNKTCARYLEIKTPNNHTLRFEAIDEAFQFKVLGYDEFLLESLNRWNELPKDSRTYITIIGKQRGIGGDDSWGAPVYPQYEIDASKPFKFKFKIKYIK